MGDGKGCIVTVDTLRIINFLHTYYYMFFYRQSDLVFFVLFFTARALVINYFIKHALVFQTNAVVDAVIVDQKLFSVHSIFQYGPM